MVSGLEEAFISISIQNWSMYLHLDYNTVNP